jgi:hypothetical protein
MDLSSGIRTGRQLEVPACIWPAGTAAKGDVIVGEIVAGGVEVHRLESLRRLPLSARDDGKSVERWRHGAIGDVELPFHLEMPGCFP